MVSKTAASCNFSLSLAQVWLFFFPFASVALQSANNLADLSTAASDCLRILEKESMIHNLRALVWYLTCVDFRKEFSMVSQFLLKERYPLAYVLLLWSLALWQQLSKPHWCLQHLHGKIAIVLNWVSINFWHTEIPLRLYKRDLSLAIVKKVE